MATTIGALRVELSANIAKFETAMGKAATHMARTQRSFERFGSRASAAGRSLSVGLTAPLVAVGALSAKSFLSFERGMNKVAAVSGATEAEMAELTAIAKDLGATTSFSAAQAAEGLGFLAQAGFDATEAGRALPGVLQLAAAGGIELAAAADIATNVLAGYGLEVDQLARVNDVLAKASISTNTNVQQLGESFKFSGAVASSAGISFEEAGAAMALMGNAGIQAEMAGTSLQQAIFRLVKPTNEAAGVMEKLGIHGTDAHGRLLPLDQIVEQLEPHFKNTAAMATIFGSRAIKGMGALVAEGSDKLRALTTELEQAGGTAQEVADKKLAGLTGAWTRLQSATEGVFIEIGSRLRPVLERLAAFLTDRVLPAVRGALEAFDRLSPGMQTAVIAATAVTAALGPLLIALGGLVAVLTPLVPLFVAFGKMTAVTTALAALKTVLVAVGLAAPAAAAGVVGVGTAATGTTAAVNTTTLSLARLRVALLTQLPTFTRWGRAITGAAATAGTAMSGLAAGAGAKLAGAFGGLKVAASGLGAALVPLAPAAAIVATGFASWKLGRWIGETTGLTDAVERLALRLQGFTDEEIRTVQASRQLAADLDRLDQEMQDLAASGKQTREEMDRIARQAIELRNQGQMLTTGLARVADRFEATARGAEQLKSMLDALSKVTSLDYLHDVTLQLAESGELSSDVMRGIAKRAQELQGEGDALTEVLQNVVNAYGKAATAGKEFGERTGALAEDVQALIDTWTGANLKSDALVAGFEALTDAQRGNDRLMAKVIGRYDSMREILGPFHEELEQLWQTHERLKTPLESNTALTDRFMEAQIAATQAQAALNERLEAHRRALLNLPAEEAIAAFEELRTVWDTLSESERADATEAYSAALQQAAESGIRLTAKEAALVGQDAGMNWVDGFFGTLSRAFEGGGGFAGGLQSLASQGLGQTFSSLTGGEGGGFTQALGKIFSGGGVLGKIGSIGTKIGSGIGKFLSLGLNGVPIVGPFLAAFGGPLLKGVGKLFKKMFGGPSEAELAGRQAWRSYTDGLAAEANAEQIQQALGAGWANVEDAKAWIVLRDAVMKAGGSAAEAEGLWHRYVAAIKQGPEAVAAVTRELDGWRQKAGEVAQAEAEIAARNTALAGSLAGLVEAGHAAFNPAQLDPYLAQMEELGLVTAAEAAALRQLADDAHVDWRAMEESATQYGVAMKTVLDEHGNEVQVFDESLLGLGHAQAKLTDEAGQLAAAWSLLTGEGTNTQVAIEGMTDEAQGFITKALAMGIALPEAMRPMLDAMVSQGRLTDENGDKLTDLSGITFAAPIAEGFDLLADKIQLLIITLGGPSGLSKAVEDMAASANLDIKGLAGEWAGMTDEMKTEFGSFAAFVEDRALREIAESAGLNYDAIAERWKGMTDAQQTAFGSFRDFLKNEELKKLADDAGLTFDDLEQQWEDMTDAQRDAVGSFRQFVNQELDKIKNKHIVVDLEYRQRETGRRPDHAPQPSGGGAGFQRGSPFRDFGRGTPAMLHGLERVMTAPEGRGIAEALGRITGGLAAIADLSGVRSLATGGLVTRPMIAQLHPSEAVVPLDRMAEFGGGRRVEAKLDQLHQDFALLLDEFRHGLDPRRRARAVVAAAALSTT